MDRKPRDNGSDALEKYRAFIKYKNLQKDITKESEKVNYYHFAFLIKAETEEDLSNTLQTMKLTG